MGFSSDWKNPIIMSSSIDKINVIPITLRREEIHKVVGEI